MMISLHERVKEDRPEANEIAVQRAIFHELEERGNITPDEIMTDEVIQHLDSIERVNDLDWFADELPNNIQRNKIIADTLCRSDILFNLVEEKLNHPRVRDLSNETPFTIQSLLLYIESGIRPIMQRWDINTKSSGDQLTITLNTSMIKTNDFQMIKQQLEEEGKNPAYIDWKDYVLFHVVCNEFGGPPEIQITKTWTEIFERVSELGIDKWNNYQSAQTRWRRLKKKISADQYGEKWLKDFT